MSVKSLSNFLSTPSGDSTVSFFNGQWISIAEFKSQIIQKTVFFSQQSAKNFAIYHEQAYPFAVELFALLYAQKNIWLAANNCPATAEKLKQTGCVLTGDWNGQQIPVSVQNAVLNLSLPDLDLKKINLHIFTSGSSGQPKVIAKSMQQFQDEIERLEKLWGITVNQSMIAATVSHQHIYGLIFRVLWPLAAGRCFFSSQFLSPESLFKTIATHQACWIASPAQLKRLDEHSDWKKIRQLSAIFSSGGPLSRETAQTILQKGHQAVIEIYGSSETGGIAWRKQTENSLWTALPDVKLESSGRLSSPWISHPIFLDDQIKLHADGLFELSGRKDRIVKIEEKRLSLSEMEQAILKYPEIADTHIRLLPGKRDKIIASLALTDTGIKQLEQSGRGVLIKNLRKQLSQIFEATVLPRKWLLFNSIPMTTQGKTDHTLLTRLASLDKQHFPFIRFCRMEQNTVSLDLSVQAELCYFQGHFPEQPILPGVTQIFWADYFGRLFFNITQPFLRMEVIKFKSIIQPKEQLTLKLSRNTENGKLYFDIFNNTQSFASGRLVYGEHL